MRENSVGQESIVVGVDGSEEALRAVRWGAMEAARRQRRLTLVHALGIPNLYLGAWPPSHELRAKLAERGREFLAAGERAARESAQVDVEVTLDNDNPSTVLVRASRPGRLVVLGASGRGRFLDGLTPGSTAVQVSAHANGPVVIVRGQDAEHRIAGPVLVGVDGSHISDAAVGYAFEEAALRGAELVAVHAWHDDEAINDVLDEARFSGSRPVADIEQQVLVDGLAGWREKHPEVSVRTLLEHDKPRHALMRLSQVAQLVVVGSRGHGGFTGLLLGSTSQALIHHAGCPVVVVRP